jgi:tetratricopeptide (TPR) repeat protein
MARDLCFVLMPFGKKPDASGTMIDFDAIFNQLIAPGIRRADMEPLRADEEQTGGIIHKPMFERLMLCPFAVADLSTANANVFYELGIRHALRPYSTVLIFGEGGRLPFDVSPLRALPYKLTATGSPADPAGDQIGLATRLKAARDNAADSPLFQLIDGLQPLDISHIKTDVFREQVQYSADAKNRLATARQQGPDAVRAIEKELTPIADAESGVVIDLFLSYRAVKAWDDMIALAQKMSAPLAATVMVQEQLALALNRAGQGEQAEKILLDLIHRRGPSSETYGLLGRVYKDRWDAALKSGDQLLARGTLEKAISAYLRGFEADWRDAYPGINAVTLMELHDPPDPRRLEILPVVNYSVGRKIATGQPDYWDYATLLELAVLAKNQQRAEDAASNALAAIRETWEPETTASNLRMIRETRERRGDSLPWAKDVENELLKRAATKPSC